MVRACRTVCLPKWFMELNMLKQLEIDIIVCGGIDDDSGVAFE